MCLSYLSIAVIPTQLSMCNVPIYIYIYIYIHLLFLWLIVVVLYDFFYRFEFLHWSCNHMSFHSFVIQTIFHNRDLRLSNDVNVARTFVCRIILPTLLYQQSKRNAWLDGARRNGLSVTEAFDSWKRIYNTSMVCYLRRAVCRAWWMMFVCFCFDRM
jgi:hypothetical protein